MLDSRSSLTVAGWAEVSLTDGCQIDRERGRRDGDGFSRNMRSGFWAFRGNAAHGGRDDRASQSANDHNEQVAKLLGALGESYAGRRAILRAAAGRQGIDDEDKLEDLLHRRSTRKLQVPPGLREALLGVGLDYLMVRPSLSLTRAWLTTMLVHTLSSRSHSAQVLWFMSAPLQTAQSTVRVPHCHVDLRLKC